MSERKTLLKKAVLTGVGASTNFDRIRDAIEDAMHDLVKVGQDLIDDLEEQGKEKAENAQSFLRNLQEEAAKKSGNLEAKMSVGVKSKAKDLGLVTREEFEDIVQRLEALENAAGLRSDVEEKKKAKSKKHKDGEENHEEQSHN